MSTAVTQHDWRWKRNEYYTSKLVKLRIREDNGRVNVVSVVGRVMCSLDSKNSATAFMSSDRQELQSHKQHRAQATLPGKRIQLILQDFAGATMRQAEDTACGATSTGTLWSDPVKFLWMAVSKRKTKFLNSSTSGMRVK